MIKTTPRYSKTFINFIVERSENDKGLKIEDFKNFFYNNHKKPT